MFEQFTSAIVRAFLMALLLATPALILPNVGLDATQIVLLFALFTGCLIFIEYFARYPSIVEFRYAPPFNRLRFIAIFLTVLSLSIIARARFEPNALSSFLEALGVVVGNVIDFPYSPVQLMVIMLPDDASQQLVVAVRSASGLAYLISLIMLAVFYFYVRILDWPARGGAFNVWVNLPLFDPTAGGDVLPRLNRDGQLNIAFGFLMPFLIPAIVQMMSDLVDPIYLDDPQTLIWTISGWAFIPASLIMRGMAMLRVAQLIDENRKRAYAAARGLQAV
ncbi:hypothetical protein SAMN04490248_102294 [Salinihabitans flavidus]|uniref:Uncharacterized protein n=1 Tax=Salinihabitans flavidus TaxID=569882 RepID=A0A1H8MW93_9RHOB|nr:hypothetical protein [Salinihabitans flavidus]SEO21665.1 hypothetical protein SAMN04490248_102294 [Salinihabitans flavidus]